MTRALVLFFVSIGSVFACTPDEAPADGAPRPNVLVVMADDMGFSDLGCYGGEIETPTLDALAAGGLRFRSFYNGARCCPTRAALLSGRHPHQAGIGHMTDDHGTDAYRGELSREVPTIAEALRDAGYHTWMAGKWHVTRHLGQWSGNDRLTSKENWPRARGFDRFYGTILGAGSYFDPITLVDGDEPAEPDRDDYYYTDVVADRAVRFIREHVDDEAARPFFGYLSFTAPHWPLHAPPDAVEKVRGRYDDGWDALREERHARMVAGGVIDARVPLSPRATVVKPWSDVPEATRFWERRAMEVYAAQVELMDAAVGRVVAALRETGALDDTLVLFLADNGGCAEELTDGWGGLFITRETRDGRPVVVGNDRVTLPGPETTYMSYGRPWANASNTPFRMFKHFVHEGGIASPLIVHWPNMIREELRGTWRDDPGHVIDVMATAVDVAGAERAGLEGVSLAPTIGGALLENRALFWEHEGNRAVRRGGWKAVGRHRKGGAPWELYEILADRSEANDLAAEHPEILESLVAEYDAWATRCGVRAWPLR